MQRRLIVVVIAVAADNEVNIAKKFRESKSLRRPHSAAKKNRALKIFAVLFSDSLAPLCALMSCEVERQRSIAMLPTIEAKW